MNWPNKSEVVRTGGAWVAAVLLTTVLGSVAQTQFNLAALIELGAQIPASLRLKTTALDIIGFSPSFGPLVAIGFLIAFGVARGLRMIAPGPGITWYALAGGVAVLTILLSLNMAFDITPIAAARTNLGLGCLVAGGLVGGAVFARLLPQRSGATA